MPSKTNKELLKELKELKRENNLLKTIHDQAIIQHKQTEAILLEGEKNYKDLIIQGYNINITERKLAEELIQELSKKWQRTTFNAIKGPILLLDPDGTIIQSNSSSNILLGKKEEEILGCHCYELMHKLNCQIDSCPLVRSKLSKQRESMLLPFDDKWFEVLVDPILDDENNLKGFVHILHDITIEKQVKEELLFQNEILNNMNEALYLVRMEDGIIVYTNNEFVKMFGYEQNEMIGKHVSIVNDPAEKNPEDTARDVIAIIIKNGLWEGEIKNIRKDGTPFWSYAKVTVFDHSNFGRVLISFHIDITVRKQAEQKIIEQNEKLSNLNFEKDKFFSIIAHDLRNPFLRFLAQTEILAKDFSKLSTDELLKLAVEMNKSSQNLLDMLQNLLQWTQLKKDSLSFNPVKHSLSIIVSLSIKVMNHSALQKEITILNEVPANQKVFADERIIYSILGNLLSNAVKFTRKGGKVTVKSKKISNGMVEIVVQDTGVGISKHIIKKLFKINEKVGSKGTEGELSTGMGLILCKELVEKNGGRIWVESEEENGSKFYFTVPTSSNP